MIPLNDPGEPAMGFHARLVAGACFNEVSPIDGEKSGLYVFTDTIVNFAVLSLLTWSYGTNNS